MTELATELANTFEVWHRTEPTFFDNPADVLSEFPAGFEHVANVKAGDVGRVFQLTNHIDSDWTENFEVEPLNGRSGQNTRSTSVGDVIVRALAVGVTHVNGEVRLRWDRWSIEMIGLKKF